MKKSMILVAMLSVGYAAAQYDGKVGINTDVPSATLNVKSATGSAGTDKNLELMDAAGTKRVTVLNNGKVGIGIDSPDRPLHIQHWEAHKMRFQHAGVNDMWTDFGKRENGAFFITNWANSKWNPAIGISNDGYVGLNIEEATERLDVNGGNVRVRALPSVTGGASDKVVVVDNTGVLKSVDRSSISGTSGLTSEVDGIIGNEVTGATANGGLVRSGSGTASSPYTLGLPAGTAVGQTMVWNGTAWEVKTPEAGASLSALTGKIHKAPSITAGQWKTDGIFLFIQTSNDTIKLPNPADFTNKIISVNNAAGQGLNYAGEYSPHHTSTLDGGKGHILMSDGTDWYVIGGSY